LVHKFIDFNTAVLLISFNCYDPSSDRFIATQMTFSFEISGKLFPQGIKVISFALDQLEQTASNAFVVDMIQLFFCFCYLLRIVLIKIPKRPKPGDEIIEGYNLTQSILIDSLVIIFFCLKFYFSQLTNYHDLDGILNDEYPLKDGGSQYIEMMHYADYYIEQYQMYTLIVLLNMFNLLNALRIIRIVHWIMLIVEKTFNVISLFMMLLIPC